MNDHYGRTNTNLNPISCPLVLMLSMSLLPLHMVIVHWLKGYPGGMPRWSRIMCHGCRHVAQSQRSMCRVVSFFKKFSTWCILIGSCQFNIPTLLTINRGIPFLPFYISHIFFSDISRLAPRLEVSFCPQLSTSRIRYPPSLVCRFSSLVFFTNG